MNTYARFDEIPSMTLKDIKETKRYGRTDNVKTVYPPTNTLFAGITRTVKLYFMVSIIKVQAYESCGWVL